MAASSLKRARLCTFMIHGGYLLMIVLLITTNNWMIAFSGIVLALVGFATTGQAAKCPRCSGELLNGSAGIVGVSNLLRLSAGSPIRCSDCEYEIQKTDYA